MPDRKCPFRPGDLSCQNRFQRLAFFYDEVEECRYPGRASEVGMRKQAPASRQLWDGSQHAHEVRLGVAQRRWERANADAGLHRVDKAKHAVVARRHPGVRRDLLKPFSSAVIAERFVESDQRVMRQVLN
jgi:hypothetical protein